MNAKDPAYGAKSILDQVKRRWSDEQELRAHTRDGWTPEAIEEAQRFIGVQKTADKSLPSAPGVVPVALPSALNCVFAGA